MSVGRANDPLQFICSIVRKSLYLIVSSVYITMSEPKQTENGEKGGDKKPDEVAKQEKPEEDYSAEDSVFSLKRPKDIREGLGQGVGNILKGAFGGAALLVSAPIKGALDGGNSEGSWGAMKGFGAGLGIGVVGGMTMIVGGAVTGVAQIGRGLYNTPGSISAISAGKDLDAALFLYAD